MSKFWCESGDNSLVPSEEFTYLLIPERKDDGSSVMVTKVIEVINSPLDVLSFDDFALDKCLRNGVSYKALSMPVDMRMGHDAEFEAFDARVEEIKNNLFVSTQY